MEIHEYNGSVYPAAVCIHPHEYTLIVTNGQVVDVVDGRLENALTKSEFADSAVYSGLDYYSEIVPMFDILEQAYWSHFATDHRVKSSLNSSQL